jgi:hypothetical protein
MSEDTPPFASLFDPRELELAAAACCGRFGDPTAETQRLVTQRDLIAASSALAHELETFAKAASAHLRGVHCTANMQPEAASLARAMVAWTEQVQAAANAHRDWQEERTLTDIGATRRARAALSSLPSVGVVQPPLTITPLRPSA